MQLTRCPVCHSRIALDALVQDAAGRELLALLAGLDTLTGTALISYLGLFRPRSRDLSNARALRLAREVLDLADLSTLSIALSETVEALRDKNDFQKLTNHRYLIKVIGSVNTRPVAVPRTTTAASPSSKTGQAYLKLERLINEPGSST